MTREAPAAAPAPSLSAADVGSDLRQEHVVFELHAPNAEGPRGEVRLVPEGESTVVMTQLVHAERGTTYSGGIYAGICERLDAAVAPLREVTTQTLGSGNAVTEVAVPTRALTDRAHAVAFRSNEGELLVCASVPTSAVS